MWWSDTWSVLLGYLAISPFVEKIWSHNQQILAKFSTISMMDKSQMSAATSTMDCPN